MIYVKKGGNMDISEKELSVVQDLLNEEELLVKKFQMLANHSKDETISGTF